LEAGYSTVTLIGGCFGFARVTNSRFSADTMTGFFQIFFMVRSPKFKSPNQFLFAIALGISQRCDKTNENP